MNHYADLQRRVHFMVHELRLQRRDITAYTLVISRDVFANVLCDAGPMEGLTTSTNSLFGFKLGFAPDTMRHYVALVHEVRG